MNSSNLKTILLAVNIALGIVFLAAAGIIATNNSKNKNETADYIKTVTELQVPAYEHNDENLTSNAKDMVKVFKSRFTNTLGSRQKPAEVVNTTVDPIPVRAKAGLATLITIKGINWSGDETSMIIIAVKGKDFLLEIGDTVEGINPPAKLLRCKDYMTAVFEYGGNEVEISMDLNTGDIASPIEGGTISDTTTARTNPRDTKPDNNKPDKDETQRFEATFDEGTSTWNVPEQEVNWVFDNLEYVKKQVSFVPDRKDGKVVGLRIARMDDDSIARRRGFQRWDTIVSVNGKKVASTNELYQLQHDPEIQRADVITIVFLRSGQTQTMNFRIK